MPVAERFHGANIIGAGKLSPYWGEDAARYVFAAGFAEGRAVLDIACGTGYGLGILKRSAVSVTGVDLDFDAIRQAKVESGVNARVLLGSGLSLPFADETFEIITSFETLEHLHERSAFLAELERVLVAGGLLILSTPNANYTTPTNGKPHNPFHVFEYTPEELMRELEPRFLIKQFLGQSLDPAIKIPPFHDAQQRLPRDLGTRSRLLGWKVLNKLPFGVREAFSQAVWKKPFYPAESDYAFSPDTVDFAPVLVAVCVK
jgi:ubiquinone/menaquinone biosynthesis C-methylase UbiE